jgi:hypothetical protein
MYVAGISLNEQLTLDNYRTVPCGRYAACHFIYRSIKTRKQFILTCKNNENIQL